MSVEKYGDKIVTGGRRVGDVEEYNTLTLRELYVKEVLGSGLSQWSSEYYAMKVVSLVDAVLKEMKENDSI